MGWLSDLFDSITGGGSSSNNNNDNDNDKDDDYEIKSGDTLSEIAEKNNMSVKEIMDANPQITDPDKIYAGDSLDLSGAGSGSPTYDGGVGLGGVGSDKNDDDNKQTTTVVDPNIARSASWSDPANWIVTSDERGDLQKEYIGSEPPPSDGNYTVPSFAAIASGTSKPASSLDVVVEGGQAYVTDKAGNKFTNVDTAAASDITIDRQVSSYEDPSNYRIDSNEQDELVRVYVGDEDVPPISYTTPDWVSVDEAQASADDADEYYDLSFAEDGTMRVLDSYGNSFDTITEANANDVRIADRLNPENYEVVTTYVGDDEGGITLSIGDTVSELRYTGEYDDPVITGDNTFEAPSITEVLNATTYKDKPYRVEYNDDIGTLSVFALNGDQVIMEVNGTEVDDDFVNDALEVVSAGYTPGSLEYLEQLDALFFDGSMFLDENMDGIPDMEISPEVRANSAMNFMATAEAKKNYQDAAQVGEAPAPTAPGNRAGVVVEDSGRTFGDTIVDGAKGFGTGVVNSAAFTLTGISAVQKAAAANAADAYMETILSAGDELSRLQGEMNELMSDETIARGLMASDDPLEYLSGLTLSNGRNAAIVMGRINIEQQRILTATEDHNAAMEAAGIPMDETYWGAFANSMREKGLEFIGEPGDADSTSFRLMEALGTATTYLALGGAASVVGGPAAAAAMASTAGALMNAGSMYDEAYAFTLTQTDPDTGQLYTAEKADEIARQGTGYAVAIGSLEGIPIARALGFVPPQFGNQLAEVFADTITEGGQEALTQTLNNLTAQGIWDPDRGMFDGTVDAAIFGAAVGGVLSTGVRMSKAMVDGLKANGYSDAEIDMIEASEGGIVTGEMSPARIEALLDRGYTVNQISGVFGNLTGTNTINAMTELPEMTIEGLAANSAFGDTMIKTGAGDPAIMYRDRGAITFSANPSKDAVPVYLDVQNPLTIESIGTPKGQETLTEVFGSQRASALISEFQQTGRLELTDNDVQAVSNAGYDGVIDNDSGKVYVTKDESVYEVSDPETTTEETVVATKPEWKTQLDEAFYLTGSIDLDMAKRVEEEFGVSPTEINDYYQDITASDQLWEQRLLSDYLTKGYIDLETMLRAEEDFGVSMQQLGNFAEYLDSDLAAYNEGIFGEKAAEITNLTETRTTLEGEIETLEQQLADLNADYDALSEQDVIRRQDVVDLTTKRDELQNQLDAKNEELSGVQKSLDDTALELGTVQEELGTAETSIETLEGELKTANESIETLTTDLGTANENVTTLTGQLETLTTENETLFTDLNAASSRVVTLEGNIDTKNLEIEGLEADLLEATTELENKLTELETLSGNLDTSQETITKLNEEISGLEAKRDELDGDLTTALGERDSLQGTLDEVTAQRDELQTSFDNQSELLSTTQGQLDAANEQVTNLTSQKEALETEVTTLTDSLAIETAKTETQGTTITDLTASLNAANQDIGTLTTQLEAANGEVTTLEGQLEEANNSLTATQGEKDAIALSLEEARGNVESLTESLTTRTTERDALDADLTEMTTAFELSQERFGFAQNAMDYVNNQLDLNVKEDVLVADLVTQGYTAANAQSLVDQVQQNRFEQSELARLQDVRRQGAFIPFGDSSLGGFGEEDEVTYPNYPPPGTGSDMGMGTGVSIRQPQAPQEQVTEPVYEPPRFGTFSRDDATPIAGGPAVELDQFGQPILTFGPSGRPLGSYLTMPTSVDPLDPYTMVMPDTPAFNPQQPVVRGPFPQQAQPVINQGIGGLGKK